ncbi:hypothetical protein COY07_04975 [Candidatus Peregrinibacteria bacterium CG_4_10_14_0_2_um_filter_43_11]|nr:MAG: hypothetical protein COY07_04975 [Candidatus Peregrinibacteria bacterium CG_4_10_14_0_2_um_filter_43_11]
MDVAPDDDAEDFDDLLSENLGSLDTTAWEVVLGEKMAGLAEQSVPQATLDLHGVRVGDAFERVATFLLDQREKVAKVVLIITGKGIHSRQKGVLLVAIRRQLHRLQKKDGPVHNFDADCGGGAFLVRLKPQR